MALYENSNSYTISSISVHSDINVLASRSVHKEVDEGVFKPESEPELLVNQNLS